MVDYRGDTIFLTRGDTAKMNLTIYRNSDKEKYTIKDTDVIQFFLLTKPSKKPNSKVILTKTFSKPESGETTNMVSINFESTDTLYLGRQQYYYIITLTQTEDTKTIDTVSSGRFYLCL